MRGWSTWPVRLARRILRRILKPSFAEMQSALDALSRDVAALREDVATNKYRRREAAQVDEQSLALLGACTAQDAREWEARSARAAARPNGRLKILFALSSGSQMYSGIGRAIFGTTRRLGDRIDYAFAIDDCHERNVKILARFCRECNLPLHVGKSRIELSDPISESLAETLRRDNWDAIECVSFASSATNGTVLEYAGDRPILYTPHFQPMSTIPVSPERARKIDRVHGDLLRRSAVVFCDSPWEWLRHRATASPDTDCAYLPLGFEPSEYRPGTGERRPELLFVGDLVETRKRFPLTLEVFAEILRMHPQFRLVVVGNKSDEASGTIPAELRSRCDLKGYVSESELHRHYRESAGLLLLSDYEAFGIPILEALACGTPVFLSRRPTVVGLFGRYAGAVFLSDDTPAKMAEAISAVLSEGPSFISSVLADRAGLESQFAWNSIAAKRWTAIRAAVPNRRAGG